MPNEKMTREELISEMNRFQRCYQVANETAERAIEALIWASGSDDFAPNGKAREGWLKIAQPIIDERLSNSLPSLNNEA